MTFKERARELVSKMTLAEKISQMTDTALIIQPSNSHGGTLALEESLVSVEGEGVTVSAVIPEQNGFTVYLCHDDHTGRNGAQYNKEKDLMLKQHCQRVYEQTHTRAEWMELLGKNYLEE